MRALSLQHPLMLEAVHKVLSEQFSISEAAQQYALPKRSLYRAVRLAQAKPKQQNERLRATKQLLEQHLSDIERSLQGLQRA
ncbi:helix-turn-helix domain-containing protein [Pseudoalteromonas sp. T1lg23B]|uniref:helix-turn-helix domain-containing protein n=1 Tax=Pseudoalteromonas sp. T1lg23B TaxID=2077097 RepID=UPI000CF71788|nr:helix-turn-helix domain-containing protein [Pseudoalteromonas sp. T1lg23B]